MAGLESFISSGEVDEKLIQQVAVDRGLGLNGTEQVRQKIAHVTQAFYGQALGAIGGVVGSALAEEVFADLCETHGDAIDAACRRLLTQRKTDSYKELATEWLHTLPSRRPDLLDNVEVPGAEIIRRGNKVFLRNTETGVTASWEAAMSNAFGPSRATKGWSPRR